MLNNRISNMVKENADSADRLGAVYCLDALVDFEGIDSSLADNFGRSVIYFLSVITTLTTVSVVGGIPFLLTALLIGMLYYNCESQALLSLSWF